VFFGVFRLGLAGNEDCRWRWWVTAGSAGDDECQRQRGEGEEEE
jgi:hypothetical protein